MAWYVYGILWSVDILNGHKQKKNRPREFGVLAGPIRRLRMPYVPLTYLQLLLVGEINSQLAKPQFMLNGGYINLGLNHWGRMMQICISILSIIGSDNGLSHICW